MKQFKITKNFDYINGTHLQGHINISFAELVKILGNPQEKNGEKVDAEWYVLSLDSKTTATVYNYKTGKNYLGDDGLETKDIIEWNIGGHSRDALKLIQSIFPDARVVTMEERMAEISKRLGLERMISR